MFLPNITNTNPVTNPRKPEPSAIKSFANAEKIKSENNTNKSKHMNRHLEKTKMGKVC
jgi:hypothetical protein